ncbi:hypothetical protein JOC37_002607 [Desulfohalotomaculum tongense]|nr:hypothetical protein [Desulforadius tongensis]
MKLTGLKELYKSMKSQDIDRYKFDFIYNITRLNLTLSFLLIVLHLY